MIRPISRSVCGGVADQVGGGADCVADGGWGPLGLADPAGRCRAGHHHDAGLPGGIPCGGSLVVACRWKDGRAYGVVTSGGPESRDPACPGHGALDFKYRGPATSAAIVLSQLQNGPLTIPTEVSVRSAARDPHSVGQYDAGRRGDRRTRELHRATFSMPRAGLWGGLTKCVKSVKILAIMGRHGLPLSVSTHAANHHEVTLVQLSIDRYMLEAKPKHPIGDRAYDSDGLDEDLK